MNFPAYRPAPITAPGPVTVPRLAEADQPPLRYRHYRERSCFSAIKSAVAF